MLIIGGGIWGFLFKNVLLIICISRENDKSIYDIMHVKCLSQYTELKYLMHGGSYFYASIIYKRSWSNANFRRIQVLNVKKGKYIITRVK